MTEYEIKRKILKRKGKIKTLKKRKRSRKRAEN
jgi:hypothetical protein